MRKITVSRPFHVTVNYRQSFWRMIELGAYDIVDGPFDVKEATHASSKPEKIEVFAVRFSWCARTKEVLRSFDCRNLRPATLAELLALGAQYSNLQRKFPIVALGTYWWEDSFQLYPHLTAYKRWRKLSMMGASLDDSWFDERFACVRK